MNAKENKTPNNNHAATPPHTEEQLLKFIRTAILAPSGHNTQPWRFKISNRTVEVYADRTRGLPVVDPVDRELTISCGAAIGFFEIATRHSGYDTVITYTEGDNQPDLFARLELIKGTSPTNHEIDQFDAISNRVTNRNAFSMQPVPVDVLETCKALSRKFNVDLTFSEKEVERSSIAQLVAQGDEIQFKDPAFREELAHWVRSSFLGSKDGLSEKGFGMPDILSSAGRLVIRTFDIGGGIAADNKKKIISASPVLAIFGTSDDNQKSWLNTGRALANVLVFLTSHRLASSYLNQPIEVAPLRHKLKLAANIETHPQILVRIGYCEKLLSPTVRRELEDVMIT